MKPRGLIRFGVALVLAYAILAALSLVVASLIWSARVSGKLYRCTDRIPGFEFVPPFVHTHSALPGQTGDELFVPESQLNALWRRYVGISLVVPALVVAARAIQFLKTSKRR